MPKKCCVCNVYFMKENQRSMHKFPKNLLLRKKWFALLGISDAIDVSVYSMYVCSDHFVNTDFYYTPTGIRHLKDDAVPTIYSTVQMAPVEHGESASSSERVKILQDKTLTPAQQLRDFSEEMEFVETQAELHKKLESNAGSDTETAPETAGISNIVEIHQKVGSSRPEIASTSSTETATEIIDVNQPSSSTVVKKRKSRKVFFGDISLKDLSNPKRAKKCWKIISDTISNQRKKIRQLQQGRRRLKSRISSLKSLMNYLREKKYISENAETTIQASFPGTAGDIIKRMLKGPKRGKYNPSLRSFALTLNFFSPKAYSFVREEFNNSLPHPSTINKWYQTVDGSPGFTKESFTTLKMKCESVNHKVLCNLVLDEMSIRKRLEWTGTQYKGFVDLGTNLESDCLPKAKEALVFMLVAINFHWKIPIGYFLLDGLSGSERANLVRTSLSLIHNTGVIVTSLTFDGAAANIAMATSLGAAVSDPDAITPFFLHPVTNKKVFIFFDACHMLKLIRNCLGTHKIIEYKKDKIEWRYVENLVNLQNVEGLHAGTKIKNRHLLWTQEKMKVKIAAQTLSKSVSDALLYLCEDLQLHDFLGAQETAKFIKLVNDFFDILNSRNNCVTYVYKKPLSPSTKQMCFEFLENAMVYFKSLTLHGVPILHTARRTGFLGFIICAKSLMGLYNMYIDCQTPLIKYFLSYKFSQDHLEIFFSVMRSRGGYNNNPTARQFEATYKRLLIHAQIKGADLANVTALDATTILNCTSRSSVVTRNENEQIIDIPCFASNVQHDHDYVSLKDWHLTDYVCDIVEYIAGFVVKVLKQKITCSKCLQIMESESPSSRLQIRKKFGNLINASSFVFDICKCGEKQFRFVNKSQGIFNANISNINLFLISSTVENIPRWIFDAFKDHIYDEEPLENHSFGLIKLILQNYFSIRIHYECNKLQDDRRIRPTLTKSILFQNQ